MKKINVYISILSVMFLLSSCKFFKESKWFGKDDPTLSEELITDYVEPIVDSSIYDVVEEPYEEPVVTAPSGPVVGYSSDNYYMIVGSFLSEKLALKYADKMYEKGYRPNVIYSPSHGYYRVSAQSYSDLAMATGEINTFRNELAPTAWVHIKK